MLYIRSLAFNLVFYVNLIVQMILWTPYYFLSPRHRAWFVPKFWSRTSLWLYDKIAGTRSDITGLENLPEGSFILAPKHQSFWDAIAFFPLLQDPLYILKRELTWIPFFGWYIMKMRMIPVDRGSRSKALKQVVASTRQEMARNPRQLIIYPEGTRRAPGDEPAYKYGIVELYAQLGLPVVPVAHMAGLYWPRRKFMRYPGTIKAFHFHHRQTDLWGVVSGMFQVALADLRPDSPTYGLRNTVYIGTLRPWQILIPPGVAHGYKVVGEQAAMLVYVTDRFYNPTDEGRIAYNDPRINYDWELQHK